MRVIVIGVVILAFSFAVTSSAQNYKNFIDFDQPIPPLLPPSIAYGNKGIVLPRNASAEVISIPSATIHAAAHSGTHVLISSPISHEFDPDPLIVEFTAPVSSVSFYTGFPSPSRYPVTITLDALDTNDHAVANQVTISVPAPSDIKHLMQISDPHNHLMIKRIRINAISNKGSPEQVPTYEFIDDLSFLTEGKPPVLAAEPPNIYITQPYVSQPGADASTANADLSLEGNIFGKGIMPQVAPPEVEIAWPTGSTASFPKEVLQFTLGKDLAWTVPNQSLHFSRMITLKHFGRNVLTVRAFNPAGVGHTERGVQFLPQQIQDEYQKQPDRFGDFVEGQIGEACSWAVYVKGVIFSSPKGTFSSVDELFAKWNKLRTAGTTGLLGCATSAMNRPQGHRWGSPKGTIATIGDAWVQDFEHGRIYSGPKGTYYVTQPFQDAMDKLDFAVNFGIPVTDPEKRSQPLLPLVWQRFEPTNDAAYFANLSYSTMELAGNPLKLWIATPDTLGWIKTHYDGTIIWPGQYAKDNSDALPMVPKSLPARLPTVWRSYNCPVQDQPCTQVGVLASEDAPNLGPPMDYKDVYPTCGDYKYPVDGTPAWAGFRDDVEELIPVQGNAAESNLAGEDFSECHFCTRTDLGACIAGVLVGAPMACAYVDEGVDWNLILVPSPGQERVLVVNRWEDENTVNDQTTIEIEYEWCLVGYPFKLGHNSMFPSMVPVDYIQKGDGLFVAGRWIADCGHTPYKTEIHPPAVVLDWHTEAGTAPGQLATFADMIYLDWWWPNQKVSVDLYPPPRPNADATLSGLAPVWASGVNTSWLPADNPNHVHLEITGRTDIPSTHFPPYIASNGQVHYGCWENNMWVKCDDTRRSIWGFYRLQWK